MKQDERIYKMESWLILAGFAVFILIIHAINTFGDK